VEPERLLRLRVGFPDLRTRRAIVCCHSGYAAIVPLIGVLRKDYLQVVGGGRRREDFPRSPKGAIGLLSHGADSRYNGAAYRITGFPFISWGKCICV
jgi:hypothetical protein